MEEQRLEGEQFDREKGYKEMTDEGKWREGPERHKPRLTNQGLRFGGALFALHTI